MEIIKIDNDAENRLNKNKDDLNDIKKEIRNNEIKLNSFNYWINNKYVNLDEKKMLYDSIVNEIKEWRMAVFNMNKSTKKFISYCILNCESCRKWYNMENNGYSKNKEPTELIHHTLFMKKYEKLNYVCCTKCRYLQHNDNIIEEYNKRLKDMKEKEEDLEKLNIGYIVAFEQQKNLVRQYAYLTTKFKEKNSVILLKKKRIQFFINWIQISVIIISTIITFFESIKQVFKDRLDDFTLVLIPIICSSYIGLILTISRFFKFSSNSEYIVKLSEKYSFIINSLNMKRTKFISFDFKINTLTDWDIIVKQLEKDSISDIIVKANEEFDMVMSPKEFVKYKKKYTKIRLKELIERRNFKELESVVRNEGKLTKKQKEMAQKMIKKHNWFKYYFCMMCCFKERDYVDYDDVLVYNRDEFIEYFDESVRFEKKNKLYLNKVIKLENKIKKEEELTEEMSHQPHIILGMFNRCPSEKEEDSIIEKYSSSPNNEQVVEIENDEGKNIDV